MTNSPVCGVSFEGCPHVSEYLVILDPRRSTHCCVCMSGEFIHVTLLSVFGTVFVGTRELVSNMP